MAFHPPPQMCQICKKSIEFIFVRDHKNADGRFSLYECKQCQVQLWVPFKGPPSDWYEKHKAYAVSELFEPKVFREYHKEFFKKFKTLPLGSMVLDLGCGTGEFLNSLCKRGYRAWGVDFNKNSIDLAKRFFGLSTVYAMNLNDFLTIPDLPEFDVITLFEVIEHVDNPKELISNIQKILKPGGFFVLSTPSRDRMLVNVTEMDFPYHHLTRWNETSIRRLLQGAGFSIEAIHHIEKIAFIYGTLLGYVSSITQTNLLMRTLSLLNSTRVHKRTYETNLTAGFIFSAMMILARIKGLLVADLPASLLSLPLIIVDTIKTGGRGDMFIMCRKV